MILHAEPDDHRQWVIARTLPRCEQRAVDSLEAQGYAVELPIVEEPRKKRTGPKRARKTMMEPVPAFTRYVFADALTGLGIVGILQHPLVASLLVTGERFATLRPHEIEGIRAMKRGPTRAPVRNPAFVPGRRIRITEGALSGYEPVIEHVAGFRLIFTVEGKRVTMDSDLCELV